MTQTELTAAKARQLARECEEATNYADAARMYEYAADRIERNSHPGSELAARDVAQLRAHARVCRTSARA